MGNDLVWTVIFMRNDRWKRWELALALSVGITLCHGAVTSAGCSWWGVVFPGLGAAPARAAAVWRGPGFPLGGVELRFRLLDWIAALTGGGYRSSAAAARGVRRRSRPGPKSSPASPVMRE
jgi:hypothetical protein